MANRLTATEGSAATTELLGVAHINVTAEDDALLGGFDVVNALVFDDLLEVLLILGIRSSSRVVGEHRHNHGSREGDGAKRFQYRFHSL